MNLAQQIIFSLVFMLSGFAAAQNAAALDPQGVDKRTNQYSNKSADKVPDLMARSRSILRPVGNADFNKPLYFDQVDQGVVLPPMELEYALQGESSNALRIGPALISQDTFRVELWAKKDLKAVQQAALANWKESSQALLVFWPENFFAPQSLEAISAGGRLLWSQKIPEAAVNAWDQFLQKDGLKDQAPFKGSRWAVANWQPPAGLMKEAFRLCFIAQLEDEKTRLCTGYLGLQSSAQVFNLRHRIAERAGARILVDNEVASGQGALPLNSESSRVFYAELPSGILLEIFARSPKFELMDIVETARESQLRIVGSGERPLQKSVLLNQEDYSAFTKMIGFEETIGDDRVIWATAFNEKNPQLYFPGKSGGIYRQRFELSQIPSYRARVFLSRRAPVSTYASEVSLRGRKGVKSTVKSSENSVETPSPQNGEFTWNFRAGQKGQMNRSYLTVESEGQTFRSYYEIYRGYATEISARLSAVQSTNFIFMGELSFNHWFESILGWDNYWISRHRWGVSGKYFQSFNDVSLSGGASSVQLVASNVDLKYRLSPGLWGRDQTLGVLGSYQNVTFGETQAPMAGVGAFWARSMPRSLDSLMNLLPIFDYPKWVDMEFIFYTTPLSSDIALNSSMALNFHGKVLWTNSFFGEAGFGIKRYGFKDLQRNQLAELNTFYGTVGMGLSF